VIVELRKHDGLAPVLKNVCDKLPNVSITIVHGTGNGDFVREALSGIACVQNVYEMNAVNLDANTYSKLMTSHAFWDSMGDRKKTLVFQTDSGICGQGSAVGKFMKYDYCGAPWDWDHGRVGNGGFSLRDTAMARKHIQQGVETTTNEDRVFVNWCTEDPACSICPPEVGREFAVETMDGDDAWAFHNNLAHGTASICEFNLEIHTLNARAQPLGDSPNAETWHPHLSDRA